MAPSLGLNASRVGFLHQYPDRPETAKHGYGRCTHPHVESDVCQWPGNAQRFMQALGLTK